MKRFLEYDETSGRIVCELFAPEPPEIGEGRAIVEIDAELKLDVNNSAVRDGVVVRLYETAEERREREHLRREYRSRAKERIKRLVYEFMIALIEEDEARMAELREEHKFLKSYL